MASRNEAKEQKEKTSQALIESALELCAEEGYASLSLRSVARKAGIAPTSFYRHFREIDEMGVAMVEQAREALADWLVKARKQIVFSGIKPGDDPKKQMSAVEGLIRPFVKTFSDCYRQNPRLLHLFFQERTGSAEALRTAIGDAVAALVRDLTEILNGPGKALPCDTKTLGLLSEIMITLVSRSVMERFSPSGTPQETLRAAAAADPMEPVIQSLILLLLGALTLEQTKQEQK
jgi:AcrR family transcriptional regulator